MTTVQKPTTRKRASEEIQLEKRVFDFDGGYILGRLDRIEENLRSEIQALDTKFENKFDQMDTKIDKVEINLRSEMSSNFKWLLSIILGTFFTMLGFMITILFKIS